LSFKTVPSLDVDPIVITIVPTIANNKIKPVTINQIKWLEYSILPTLEISEPLISVPSQRLEEEDRSTFNSP
jgi:hypothetical protein